MYAIIIPDEKLNQSTKSMIGQLRDEVRDLRAMISDLQTRSQAEGEITLDCETQYVSHIH